MCRLANYFGVGSMNDASIDGSLFWICPTLEYRIVGSERYLIRSRDRVKWDPSIARNPRFWSIWRHFQRPSTIDSYLAKLAADCRAQAERAANDLVSCRILEPIAHAGELERLLEDSHLRSLPRSLSYHFNSARVGWVNYSNPEEVVKLDHEPMDQRLVDEPLPPSFKKAQNSIAGTELPTFIPIHALASVSDASDLFSVGRRHEASKLTLDALTFLINFTFRRTGTVKMRSTGEHFTKAVPSGGARHPIEAYVVVPETIEGLGRGAYHYNTNAHRLDKIRVSEAVLGTLVRANAILPDSRSRSVAGIILHSCIFERSMYRYRESRSYRVMHLDIGHIHANEAIIARLLRLPFRTNYSVPESPLESALCLDPLRESIMSSFVIFN